MRPFDYASLPLGKEEIRILELLPAMSPDDPITTNIFKADLDHLPSLSVSALSYCWGDIHVRGPVEITVGSDNDMLSITTSLAMALRALRRTDSPVRLWVDQICINQGDEQEKSQQIPLMRRIYSFSGQTISWLGEATKDSDLAMEYLQKVGSQAHGLGLVSLDRHTLQVLIPEEEHVDSGILSIPPAALQLPKSLQDMISEQGNLWELPALQGMLQLVMLPYFSRGWIQQEVALPSNLKLQWGHKTISSDHFAAGVLFYHIWTLKSMTSLLASGVYGSSRPLRESVLGPILGIGHVMTTLGTRRLYHSPDTDSRVGLTMASLLYRSESMQFTEPRDKIYSFLGLARDKTPPTFAVDTTKKWEDVFTDATRYIVMDGDNKCSGGPSDGVNFLSLVSFPKRSSDALPSWVPDLMDEAGYSLLSVHTAALARRYRVGGRPRPRPMLTRKELDANPATLAVQGVRLDKIIDLGPAWEDGDSGDPNQPRDIGSVGLAALSFMSSLAYKSLTIVSSNPNSKHPFRRNPERLIEAEWRVPVLNQESIDRISACRATLFSKIGYEKVKYILLFGKVLNMQDRSKIFSDLPLSEEETARLDAKHGLNDDTNPEKEERVEAEIHFKMQKVMEYMKSREYKTYTALLTAFRERRAFLTEGGYVGVGPVGMQEGDIVVVLFGAYFPFVLREKEKELGYYELVGEAYCDGVMDAEALGMGLPESEFLLE